MKFATKPTWHHPPYCRHVAKLLWEFKGGNFSWDTVYVSSRRQ